MDGPLRAGLKLAMGRCVSCYGIVKRHDSHCYTCGERLPKRAWSIAARPPSALSNLMFIASLGFTAFSFLSSHKLPWTVTLGISGVFFLVSVADRYRGFLAEGLSDKSSVRSSKSAERIAARIRLY